MVRSYRFFVDFSARTVYFLLMISFHQNDNSTRPKTDFTISDTDRQELREKKKPTEGRKKALPGLLLLGIFPGYFSFSMLESLIYQVVNQG
ncbi:MAG: hypothetical protein V9E84_06445 [Trichococcus flocculiformis]